MTNLGYVKLAQGNMIQAEQLYFKALSLDPDYDALLLNVAGLYAYKKDFKQSEIYLNKICIYLFIYIFKNKYIFVYIYKYIYIYIFYIYVYINKYICTFI